MGDCDSQVELLGFETDSETQDASGESGQNMNITTNEDVEVGAEEDSREVTEEEAEELDTKRVQNRVEEWKRRVLKERRMAMEELSEAPVGESGAVTGKVGDTFGSVIERMVHRCSMELVTWVRWTIYFVHNSSFFDCLSKFNVLPKANFGGRNTWPTSAGNSKQTVHIDRGSNSMQSANSKSKASDGMKIRQQQGIVWPYNASIAKQRTSIIKLDI